MRNELIYWDSSVVISWIRGDESPDRLQAIQAIVESVENGRYKLAVSALLYVEVLESTMPGHAIDQFKKFMQNRQMIEIIAVDIRVAEKAQSIRNKSQKKIHVPDAVHIATAIVSGAKVFHTFDDDLLQLSKKNEVEGLTITACDIPGTNLNLF